jgi:hypothetical protein
MRADGYDYKYSADITFKMDVIKQVGWASPTISIPK